VPGPPPDQRSILRALDDTFGRLRAERDTARAEVAELRATVLSCLRSTLGGLDQDLDDPRWHRPADVPGFKLARARACVAKLVESLGADAKPPDPGRPFTPDERLGNFQGRLHDLEDRVRALEARRPPRHRWRDGDPDGDLPESLRHIKGA
jgi:hypothetical protein